MSLPKLLFSYFAFTLCVCIALHLHLHILCTHLENSLILPIVGYQEISPAELIMLGQEVPAHDSATKRKPVLYLFYNTEIILNHAFLLTFSTIYF